MQEPIKAGDMCEVIGGAFGQDSPNRGKIVTVRALKGEHSEFGRIWQCEGQGLVTEFGGEGMFADFAASWLRKISPKQKTKRQNEKWKMHHKCSITAVNASYMLHLNCSTF